MYMLPANRQVLWQDWLLHNNTRSHSISSYSNDHLKVVGSTPVFVPIMVSSFNNSDFGHRVMNGA